MLCCHWCGFVIHVFLEGDSGALWFRSTVVVIGASPCSEHCPPNKAALTMIVRIASNGVRKFHIKLTGFRWDFIHQVRRGIVCAVHKSISDNSAIATAIDEPLSPTFSFSGSPFKMSKTTSQLSYGLSSSHCIVHSEICWNKNCVALFHARQRPCRLLMLWHLSRCVFCSIKAHRSIPDDVLFVTKPTVIFLNNVTISLSNLYECQPKNCFLPLRSFYRTWSKRLLRLGHEVGMMGKLCSLLSACTRHKKQWICDRYFDTLRFSPRRQLYSFDQLPLLHSPSSTWPAPLLLLLLLLLRHKPQRRDRQLVPHWMNTAQTEPSSARIPLIAIGLSRVSLLYISYLVTPWTSGCPFAHTRIHIAHSSLTSLVAVVTDPKSQYPAEKGRYHLYVSYGK